jgi:uncharacterized repeat protein (TIGR01451 family)
LFAGSVVPATGLAATIKGATFLDWNDNGSKDIWELSLTTPKTTIFIRNDDLANQGLGGFYTTETDASGNYSFSAPSAGNYTIWSGMGFGWRQTTPVRGEGIGFFSFNIANSNDTMMVDFGLFDNPPQNNLPVIAAGDNNVKITLGDSFTFVRNFTDADANDRHYAEWDFGDGNKTTKLLPAKTYSTTSTYTYTARGTYTATLKLTDSRGDTVTTTIKVKVEAPPIVDVGNDIALDVGEAFQFSGTFTDPDGQPKYTYKWDYGDGNTSLGKTSSTKNPIQVNHTFNQPGEYTLTLEVSDRNSNKGADTLIVNVRGINTDPCATGVAKVHSKVALGMWDLKSTWKEGKVPSKDDWVLIQGGHSVVLPSSISAVSTRLEVKGLCIAKDGVLQSAFNQLNMPPSWIHMNAATIHNYGKIKTSPGVSGGLLSGTYRHATDGGHIKLFTYKFVNDTTGEVLAVGRGGNDMPYGSFGNWALMEARGGNGGQIEIYPAIFTNRGLIQGGAGGSGDAFESWSNLVDGDAYGGNGGSVRIFPTDIARSTNEPTGRFVGGCGGYADGVGLWQTTRNVTVKTTTYTTTITTTLVYHKKRKRWWKRRKWYLTHRYQNSHRSSSASYSNSSSTSNRTRTVRGGRGGTVSVNLGRISGITTGCNGTTDNRTFRNSTHRRVYNTRYQTRRRTVQKWEPPGLTADGTTRFEGADEVVIFGGDGWTIDLHNLSEGAISAEESIKIAVGKGGVVDLPAVGGKVFKAKKLEVFADEIRQNGKNLTYQEAQVVLKSLAEAAEVDIAPSKILYHVEMSYQAHLVGEPNATVPVTLTILNTGPEVDTYDISVTNSEEWEMDELPETVTVNSQRRTELTFNVTLPETRGEENFITVTATSQGDPDKQAVANMRVAVIEEEAINPRTEQDENADIVLVIDNSHLMAPERQLVANVLDSFLKQFLDTHAPNDEQLDAFVDQYDEDNPPTEKEINAFLKPFGNGILPMIELITFTDDVTSRVVTQNIGEVIGRIRSMIPADSGDCANASVAALESALPHINPNGQIILATAAPPHKETAQVIAQAQQQNVKVNVLLAGSCGDEAADKALYQNIADETGGSFQWLPKGVVTEIPLKEIVSQVVSEAVGEAFEIKEAIEIGDYKASSTIRDELGNPIVGATVQIGAQTAVTDENGFWEVNNLPEGEYTVAVQKAGYNFPPTTCLLGNQEDCQPRIKLGTDLTVKVIPTPSTLKQGDNLAYLITVTNNGDETATGVVLSDVLPKGAALISFESLDDGICDIGTLTCTLPDLPPGAMSQVKLVLSNSQTNKLVNTVTVTANEYPTDVAKTATSITPYLSVSIKDEPDPVEMEGQLHYSFEALLSDNAPTNATGVKLVTQLPQSVELQAWDSADGTCDTINFPTVTCSMNDLSIGSHATVNMDVVLTDPGLLLLTNQAQITANEYPAHTDRERTKIFIGDVKVDMIFVIDDTGSMQEEIDAVVVAIKKFIAEIDPSTAPSIALVTFKNDVKVRAATADPTVLLQAVENIEISGGGTCPEASAEALALAINHLKEGGVILLATDASPFDDADIEKLAALIQSKNMEFHTIITGDCTNQNDWNALPSGE